MRKLNFILYCFLFLGAVNLAYGQQEQRPNFVPSNIIIKSEVNTQSKCIFIDFTLTNDGAEVQRDDRRILPIVVYLKKGDQTIATNPIDKNLLELTGRVTQINNFRIDPTDFFIADQRYSIEVVVDKERIINQNTNRVKTFVNVAARRIEVALEEAGLAPRGEITMADLSNLTVAYAVVNKSQDSVFDVGVFLNLLGSDRPIAMEKIRSMQPGERKSGKLRFSLTNNHAIRPGIVCNLSADVKMLTPNDPDMPGTNASGSNFGNPKSKTISFEVKPVESQIDLIIENLAIINEPTIANRAISYRFNVRNTGNGEARNVGGRVDLLPTQENGHEYFEIVQIGPGQSVAHEGRLENLNLQTQGYYLRVTVDPSRQIPETNESNNETKTFFNVLN